MEWVKTHAANNGEYYCIGKCGSRIALYPCLDSAPILYSDDHGRQWAEKAKVGNHTAIYATADGHAGMLAVGQGITPAMFSGDGLGFVPAGITVGENDALYCAYYNAGRYFTACPGKVFYSDDMIKWQSVDTPGNHVNSMAGNGAELIASTQGSSILRSPDHGATWHTAANLSLSRVVWNGTVYCGVGNGNLAYTSPDGMTWTASSIAAVDLWQTLLVDRGFIWAGPQHPNPNGVFRSIDNGVTWQRFPVAHATSGSSFNNLIVTGDQVILGLINGEVWYSDPSTLPDDGTTPPPDPGPGPVPPPTTVTLETLDAKINAVGFAVVALKNDIVSLLPALTGAIGAMQAEQNGMLEKIFNLLAAHAADSNRAHEVIEQAGAAAINAIDGKQYSGSYGRGKFTTQ